MAEIGRKALRSWRRLEKAYALVSAAIERDLKLRSLPPLIWLRALDEIVRHDEGLRPFELQQALAIEQPAVSRLLDKLIAADLIVRIECAEDRRGWIVRVTERGGDLRDRMTEAYIDALSHHFLAYASDKQAKNLDEILGDLLDGRRDRPAVRSGPASP